MKPNRLRFADSAKILWVVGLMVFCLVSFMQRISYPNEITVEGRYHLRSYIMEYYGGILAQSDTDIDYYAPYASGKAEIVLTYPDGHPQSGNGCGCCYMGGHAVIYHIPGLRNLAARGRSLSLERIVGPGSR